MVVSGIFCAFSATIPLYFIHSRLFSDAKHRRLWSILGSVTCVPLLLFGANYHSR